VRPKSIVAPRRRARVIVPILRHGIDMIGMPRGRRRRVVVPMIRRLLLLLRRRLIIVVPRILRPEHRWRNHDPRTTKYDGGG
jgi:hypothetical protein